MRFLFLIAVGVVGWLLYRLYFRSLLAQGRPGLAKIALTGLGLSFLALALTGRAPAVFVFIGALMTQAMRFAPLLIRFAPSLRRWLGNGSLPGGGPFGSGVGGADGGRGASRRVSQVHTRTLLMRFDQDTGEMTGTVLAGAFEARELADMTDDELGTLHETCRHEDAEALRLLEAWLVRERGESWGAGGAAGNDDGGATGNDERGGGNAAGRSAGDALGETEAREILGVGAGATRQEIVAAHRSLMTRLHPDKGGSTWLASRVNEARRVLVDALGR